MTNLKATQVFIPGGLPQATYVAREHLGIETRVAEWADGAHTSLLSVSGPTKTGKTVLLKRFFPDAIWLSGGMLETADEFWAMICDELEVFTEHGLAASSSKDHTSGLEGNISGLVATGSGSYAHGTGSQREVSRGRTTSSKSAARKALREQKPVIVIDDFHYVPQTEQVKLIRGLKDLVFEGLPIILVAVPHRAYDAVRVEKEMTGRVENVPLGIWNDADLEEIGSRGFSALSLKISDDISHRLSRESFGSPHLMQTHCLALARTVQEGEQEPKEPNWGPFFRERAAAASKTAFDLLKQGPRQRTDRNIRLMKDGLETDIYGAILAAIAHTGPRISLQYEEVRAALREVLASDPPQRHEITNILGHMTKIAREKMEGEPVLEYDNEYSTLYIADPFFAYYLRWAPESMKELSIHTHESN